MYIKRIQIAKYRHLENIEFGPFQSPSQGSELIVLAGPNGGGKSSVLEVISLALSQMWSLSYTLNRTAPQSSFEVTIGLLSSEVAMIEAAQGGTFSTPEAAVLEHLRVHRSYCRSSGFSGGEYEKSPHLHNTIHDIVLRVLQQHHTRPLGFSLGADRSYQRKSFDRNKLFSYTNYSTRQYAWSFAFQSSAAQYEDMFDFLITWRYHYARRLGAWYIAKAADALKPGDDQPPRDEYREVLQKVFPGYSFVEPTEDAPTDMFVRIPSGDVISFSDLSSGEKEVFFTLCFFQRHNVEQAVVLIDEPELHLHPHLSRVLLKTMQSLKPLNQIWLATQSSDVIDEAGRDRVFFIRKDSTNKAKVTLATEEQEALSCLREFFGYSGYLGLARAMVFTEGKSASPDRKLFSRLIPGGDREIKFIPTNGSSEIERVNRAVLSILEADVGWCRFFLIRDRDFTTDAAAQRIEARGSGKLFVLKRHELENYLLVPIVITTVLGAIFNRVMSPDEVLEHLKISAKRISGNTLRDMVAFRLNDRFKPEDFSIPKLMNAELVFGDSGWEKAKIDALKVALGDRALVVENSVRDVIAQHDFNILFDQAAAELESSLQGDSWISLMPGKELLRDFSTRLGLGKMETLQNALILELSGRPDDLPGDLAIILNKIATEAATAKN